jgi:hypothetical protein
VFPHLLHFRTHRRPKIRRVPLSPTTRTATVPRRHCHLLGAQRRRFGGHRPPPVTPRGANISLFSLLHTSSPIHNRPKIRRLGRSHAAARARHCGRSTTRLRSSAPRSGALGLHFRTNRRFHPMFPYLGHFRTHRRPKIRRVRLSLATHTATVQRRHCHHLGAWRRRFHGHRPPPVSLSGANISLFSPLHTSSPACNRPKIRRVRLSLVARTAIVPRRRCLVLGAWHRRFGGRRPPPLTPRGANISLFSLLRTSSPACNRPQIRRVRRSLAAACARVCGRSAS